MDLLGGFVIAFSMYSRIPMPRVEWTKERMRYALCFFPLIGLCVGAALYAFFRAARWVGAGRLFLAFAGPAVPLLITGGIHMDGFLDTTDARRSYGDREKKLEILKDPHTGAFAIIGCGLYLLFYAAAFSELTAAGVLLFSGTFVLTRALSALAVVTFPMAKKDGLAATFARGAGKREVQLVMFGFIFLDGIFLVQLGKVGGVCCLFAALMIFLWYRRMAVREFGGVTGDLAGYFLQICELALLFVCCAFSWIGLGG